MPVAERLTDAVTLYEGRCEDVLPTLAGVDAVITDPPYSEKTHAGARSNRSQDTRDSADFINFASADIGFIRSVFAACKPNRWLVSFIDWRHALALDLEPPSGLEFVRLGVWTKLNPMPQLTGDRPAMGWEAVAILHAKGKKSWNGGAGPATWNHGTSRWGYFGASNHPTEKPVGLVRKFIQQFTDVGETILDPFAGSGTTAIAAMKEGRRCILIERDPAYCEIIRRRVREADGAAPGTLFANVPIAATLFDSVQA